MGYHGLIWASMETIVFAWGFAGDLPGIYLVFFGDCGVFDVPTATATPKRKTGKKAWFYWDFNVRGNKCSFFVLVLVGILYQK